MADLRILGPNRWYGWPRTALSLSGRDPASERFTDLAQERQSFDSPTSVTGTVDVTAPPATVGASGSPIITGAVDVTAPAATVGADGSPLITGTVDAAAPPATVGADGSPIITGTVDVTAPDATVDATGAIPGNTGTVDVTAPAATVGADGSPIIAGTVDVAAPAATVAAAGAGAVRAAAAYLHCCADGDWTAAATWELCDATALLDSQASNQALTTSFVSSAAFTPGAITIDGIAVKVATRTLSPTGTMSVRLAIAGVAVAGTTVTINVSDLPDDIGSAGTSYSGCSIGWVFFKFSASVTLVAATAYTLQATTSSAAQVNCFTNGTAGNWSRLLRTTTTAAPIAGDSLFIGGEWTAAATKTDRAVTYNETASTDYGGASVAVASIGVSKGGTLNLQNTAATAYVLRLSGLLQFWAGSVHDFGVTNVLPDDSSFKLEFDCAADNDFGLCTFAGLNFKGPDHWGTGHHYARLTADAAVAATAMTLDRTTGWKSGEIVVVAPTTRVITAGEERILNADAIGTGIVVTAGLANAHQGNAAWEAQADVINLTRKFTFTSTGAFQNFIYMRGPTGVTATFVHFERLGSFTRIGFDLGGSVTHEFTDCCFSRAKDDLLWPVASGGATYIFTRCTSWQIGTTTAGWLLIGQGVGSINACTATDCVFLSSGTNLNGCLYLPASCQTIVTGSRFSGFAEAGVRIEGGQQGAIIEDCEFYNSGSGTTQALFFNSGGSYQARVRRCKFWRNVGIAGASINGVYDMEFEDCSFYGNASAGVLWTISTGRILNSLFASETGYACASGLSVNPSSQPGSTDVELHGCDFSLVAGNRIAHTTQDILQTVANVRWRLLVAGTPLRCATEISAVTWDTGTVIAWQRRDGAANIHSTRKYGYGTIDIETSTVGVATPSMKMSPEEATVKFESQKMGYPVVSGKQITFSASVRKNGTYNGNAPRLVLKANGAIGVNKDVVLDTHTAAADTWETLTGQMPATADEDGVAQVVVDCDGTAGAIFVDDFSASST